MKNSKLIMLIAVAVIALAHRSDGQQARSVQDQMRLAGITPRGAIVYLQARDFGALMRAWTASTVRNDFYKSASFTAFSKSRIYLKLQDRRQDFEKAIGFGLDESRVAELASGTAAIAVYDIGKLEVVFVTEMGRERAIATALFKQAAQFQERPSEAGVYYVRDVTTDAGRLNQQFCFAHANGKLIVTTTEGLMIRALANAKSAGADSLLADVAATAGRADGFASNDLTMWLDQARLNRNRHFNSYWVHQNSQLSDTPTGTGLGEIETGLIDLKISREGLTEQRWFVMNEAAGSQSTRTASISAEQATALLRFAPASSQLVEVRGSSTGLASAVSKALFGKVPDGPTSTPSIPDRTWDTNNEGDGQARTGRYQRLDTRFDRDVDDDQGAPSSASPAPAAAPPVASVLDAMIDRVPAAGYSEFARARVEVGRPFTRFERAVVIETTASVDRASLERALTEELRARFVVAGVEPSLSWQSDGEVRFLAQSLLEQGAAYAVSGKYLVLASSRDFAREILQASTAASVAPIRLDAAVSYYAVTRLAEARPAYDLLMSKLDGKTDQPVRSSSNDDETEETREVKFFSENLSSLVAASAVRETRLSRRSDGPVMVERVSYSW